MILKDSLREIVNLQKEEITALDTGILRTRINSIDLKSSMISILSGVRRSGKSTLLHQLIDKSKCYNYFNFEDPRALNFELTDFDKLVQVFEEEFGKCNQYFFDEVQNVSEWERFVRRLHDTENKIFITGSNASLLSRELGTRLTGRHLNYELFPFSFSEYLKFTNKERTLSEFKKFLETGGFPEFLKFQNNQILHQLFRDIITRDIIVRYNIRDQKILLELAIYLITNTGNEFSYNRLKNQFNLGSTNTVISYLTYLEESYLIFTIPRFSFSYTKQRNSLKKVYSIDTGLTVANTASFTPDKGRLLENAIFVHLRRLGNEILYYRDKFECDFIVKENAKVKNAIQVCYHLNDDNLQREVKGLKEAIKNTGAENGLIITLNQKDEIDGIKIVPAWEIVE